MKSSSRFFPARLMGADVQCGIAEDVYLIKPNTSPDKSVELALTHLSVPDESEIEQPRPLGLTVALLHGSFQNRRLWLPECGGGLARGLVQAGVDVWLMEARGHGLSPINQEFEQGTLVDYARYDIPAANLFIHEQCERAVHWLGHGAGAGALLMALASQSAARETISSVTGIGVPFYRATWSRIPGLNLGRSLTRGRLQSQSELGPETEPSSLLLQMQRESQWLRNRGEALGLDLWRALQEIETPIQWLGDSPDLEDWDPGLAQLNASGQMTTLNSHIESQAWSAESIANTLTNATKVASLQETLIAQYARGATEDDLLSTGEAAPAL